MNWHFYATVWDAIMVPLQSQVNGIVGAVLAWCLPYFKAFTILGILAMLFVAMYKPGGQDQLERFLRTAFFVAFALAVISNQTLYISWVMGFIDVVPTKLGNVIAGTSNGQQVSAAAFDQLWGKAFTMAVKVYDGSGWSVKALVVGIGCLVFVGLSLMATCFTFAIYLSSEVVALLVVTLGAPFIAMAPFEPTRRFFDGWVAACLSCMTVKVLAVLLISMLIRVANAVIPSMTGTQGGNAIEALGTLCELGILFYIFAQLAKQLPGIATGIVGGVYHEVGAYHNAIYGTATGAAKAGAGAATGGASSAASSVSSVGQSTSSVSASSIRPAGRAIG